MPRLIKLLDPRGAKLAFLVLAAVLNVAWVLVFFDLIDSQIMRYGERFTGVDTTLMLGVFIGSLSIGFVLSRLAKDRRGITYGLYGGLAGLIAIAILLRESGVLLGLVGLVAVLGGYNGGMLGEVSQLPRRRN